jgi:DNA-binding Lrp family transcriptional regulator
VTGGRPPHGLKPLPAGRHGAASTEAAGFNPQGSTTADALAPIDRRLLDALQRDFPLTARPFAAIGQRLGLTERVAIAHARRLKDAGFIRQIGPIFDTRALGYRSTLVAMRVPPQRVDQAAAVISRHPGVSHNYRRDHTWNLWFTLAVPPDEDLEATAAHLARQAGGYPYRSLPALRVFKIGVRLPLTDDGEKAIAQSAAGASSPRSLSQRDRAFVRALQDGIDIVPQPFAVVARRLGVGQEEVFAWLREAAAAGWLRRFAAILSHRSVGYGANGMVVWQVLPDRLEELAAIASSFPQVSHCYQRPTFPDWPYALFTMIHARSEGECRAIVEDMSRRTHVADYAILFSTREYKKERVRYFA